MAVDTLIPFVFVRPAINREIHAIVVKVRGRPGRFTVAILTAGRKSCRSMIRVIGLVIIRLVTAVTGIRNIAVVAVNMTGITIKRRMRTI